MRGHESKLVRTDSSTREHPDGDGSFRSSERCGLQIRSSEDTVFIKAVRNTESGGETKTMIVILQLNDVTMQQQTADRAQHEVGFTQDVLATKHKSAHCDPHQHSLPVRGSCNTSSTILNLALKLLANGETRSQARRRGRSRTRGAVTESSIQRHRGSESCGSEICKQ